MIQPLLISPCHRRLQALVLFLFSYVCFFSFPCRRPRRFISYIIRVAPFWPGLFLFHRPDPRSNSHQPSYTVQTRTWLLIPTLPLLSVFVVPSFLSSSVTSGSTSPSLVAVAAAAASAAPARRSHHPQTATPPAGLVVTINLQYLLAWKSTALSAERDWASHGTSRK
jgi:hypothetical protein